MPVNGLPHLPTPAMGSLASLRLPVPAFENIPGPPLRNLEENNPADFSAFVLPLLVHSLIMLALLVFTDTLPPGIPPGLFPPELAPYLTVMTEPKDLYK